MPSSSSNDRTSLSRGATGAASTGAVVGLPGGAAGAVVGPSVVGASVVGVGASPGSAGPDCSTSKDQTACRSCEPTSPASSSEPPSGRLDAELDAEIVDEAVTQLGVGEVPLRQQPGDALDPGPRLAKSEHEALDGPCVDTLLGDHQRGAVLEAPLDGERRGLLDVAIEVVDLARACRR